MVDKEDVVGSAEKFRPVPEKGSNRYPAMCALPEPHAKIWGDVHAASLDSLFAGQVPNYPVCILLAGRNKVCVEEMLRELFVFSS